MLYRIRSTSSEHESSETEQSEKSPLVTAKLETFAKLLFSRSMTQESTSSCKDNVSPTRLFLLFDFSFKKKIIGHIFFALNFIC